MMDKKTKTIVIVLVAVIVVGGLYFGVNRWRQQRLANQILRQAYGLNTGLLGGLAGNDGWQEQIAKELAKEEADQKKEEAREAAKTPEDRYDEAEEMSAYDSSSEAVLSDASEIVEEVFGKAKPTEISSGLWGGETEGAGYVEFTIARLTTGNDLSKLNQMLKDKGLSIIQSGIDNNSAEVTAGNDQKFYTFSFEVGEQAVSVLIVLTE